MKNEAVGRADEEEQENVMGKKSEGERRASNSFHSVNPLPPAEGGTVSP